MRLDKFVSHTTGLSRKDCHRLIRSGAVAVNGNIILQAAQKIQTDDHITCNERPLEAIGEGYWMLYKPEGYVCANKDSRHPTVIDILSAEDIPLRQLDKAQVVGRLDIDTTGLVLITTDGQWNHRITSPKTECFKRYRVTFETPLTREHINQLETGIQLDGEKRPTRPARYQTISETEGLLFICEGKFHQIKRMFAAIGNRVTRLHREAIGPITLDPTLHPGELRSLTDQEIAFTSSTEALP